MVWSETKSAAAAAAEAAVAAEEAATAADKVWVAGDLRLADDGNDVGGLQAHVPRRKIHRSAQLVGRVPQPVRRLVVARRQLCAARRGDQHHAVLAALPLRAISARRHKHVLELVRHHLARQPARDG